MLTARLQRAWCSLSKRRNERSAPLEPSHRGKTLFGDKVGYSRLERVRSRDRHNSVVMHTRDYHRGSFERCRSMAGPVSLPQFSAYHYPRCCGSCRNDSLMRSPLALFVYLWLFTCTAAPHLLMAHRDDSDIAEITGKISPSYREMWK